MGVLQASRPGGQGNALLARTCAHDRDMQRTNWRCTPSTMLVPPPAARPAAPCPQLATHGWWCPASCHPCSSNKLYILPNTSQYIDVDVGCPYKDYTGSCDAQFDLMQNYTKLAYR